MGRHPSHLVLIFLLRWWLCYLAAFCNGNEEVRCWATEREALLSFKQGLNDTLGRLSSWDANNNNGQDCCTWRGVRCHNITGHVIHLDLRNSFLDYFDEDMRYAAPVNFAQMFTHYRDSMLRGNISHSLAQLKQLEYLDLSQNDFGGKQIPNFLGSLTTLRYLNLSDAGFGGTIPPQLGNLSSLRVLALGGFDIFMSVTGIEWVSHLWSLEFLDMSFVNLSKASNWLQSLSMLPSLSELRLSECSLNHQTTTPLVQHTNFSSLTTLDLSDSFLDHSLAAPAFSWLPSLPALVSLDLSGNAFNQIPTRLQNMSSSLRSIRLSRNGINSSILPEWLYGFSSLETLDLSENKIQGTISTSFGNLTSLEELNLYFNRHVGEIPKSLGYLCNLRVLDLSINSLSGEIPKSVGNLCNLRILHLFGNNFSGGISEFLSQSSSCLKVGLETLSLYDNYLSGHLPHRLGDFEQLKDFDICSNSFSGVLPASIGRLSNLKVLRISNNSFEGAITQVHLMNMKGLRELHMSRNRQLTLQVENNSWVPPFQLTTIDMSFTGLGPQLPHWLQTQKSLRYMYISNARISQPLPGWISSLTQLGKLRLSNNNILGELPPLSSTVQWLDLSNNSISGSISRFLCKRLTDEEETELYHLDLSRNYLSGELTQCWTNWKNLGYLGLSHNNFVGELPRSMGSLDSLEYLHLRECNLFGELSHSLQNWSYLKVLDISRNEFFGSIPQWIGDRFAELRVLALRSNKLTGNIPPGLCHLKNLKILDLGNNNLIETIPNCLSNISAMASQQGLGLAFLEDSKNGHLPISYTLSLVIKSKEYEYETGFNGRTLLDFSCNSLTGKIRDELINLHNLQILNLSWNRLEGMIPKKIGDIKALESLDLSTNRLSGEIPHSIANISSLSYLNLSYNNLSGKIPTGTQIQSFSPLSFAGNDGLYGPPLTNFSTGPNPHPPGSTPSPDNNMEDEDDDKWIGTKWFYMGIPFGFAVGFWSVLIPLAVNKALRFSYNRFWDNLAYKLFRQ